MSQSRIVLRARHAVVNALVCLALVGLGQVDTLRATDVEPNKILADDGAAGDHFGLSVAGSGDTAIVGAVFTDPLAAGSAYLFKDNGLGDWSQIAELLAGDGAAGDQFGFSVSISNDTAIVGAHGDDDNGSGSGSAYVFQNDGSGWTQTAKLVASDGAAGDLFGASVSISGNTAIVGAFGDDDNGADAGAAYFFEDDGSGTWTQVAKLAAGDGSASDQFGRSVSISGSTAIIGASGHDGNGSDAGAAYVFHDDGTGWSLVDSIAAGDGASGDFFGTSVSISGSTAIIGAFADDDNGVDSGSVYLFEYDGSSWQELDKLLAADGAAGDFFGTSVSISDGAAIVGAWGDDDQGSDAGAAYLFGDDGTGWSELDKLFAGDGAASDFFGVSVGLSGGTAVIGASGDDDNGSLAGAAYIAPGVGGLADPATIIPLPASVWLGLALLGGIGGVGAIRRRRHVC